MTTLDRYLGARMIATLFKTLLGLVMLFVFIDLLTHRREDIIKYDVPWDQVVGYYFFATPQMLGEFQLAALALLISALLVLGNAAQHNEIIAALAGGLSLRRIVRAPVLVAAGLALVMLIVGETIGPIASAKAEGIKATFFHGTKSGDRAGISWANLSGKWTCHIMKYNRLARTGENVLVHSISEDRIEQIQAKRIYWDEDEGVWFLEDGRHFTIYVDQDWAQSMERVTQGAAPFHESPEELFAFEQPPATKSAVQLAGDIRRAEGLGIPTASHWTDFHAKFSQPALSFVMIGLAIPFAMRLRRGGLAIGFGVSIAIALCYLMLFRIGMGLGHIGRVPPLVAAWLANVVFLAAGVVMFWRTPT